MGKILISSDRSNGGKTTFTLCLMRALMLKGLKVQGYKCGPDYIDTGFHTLITGIKSRNLDEFLQGKDTFYSSLDKSLGDINIIEGVMGFYDGACGSLYSAHDVSNKLNIPTILVLNPKGQALTFCATLKGLLEFRKNNIKGIILNMVSKSYYELIKSYINEEFKELKVLGYMEKLKDLEFSSRHLGLIQGIEIKDLDKRITMGAYKLLETVDIDALISLSKTNEVKDFSLGKDTDNKNIIIPNIKINNEDLNNKELMSNLNNMVFDNGQIDINAGNNPIKPTLYYAKDEAFSFYYEDSLEYLRNYFNLVSFSPLRNKSLGPCDFLYLGGGYPEIYKDELSKNTSLLRDIKEKLTSGLPCYAECGGLMYLTQSIDGNEMVGFLDGNVTMTNKLQHFGYCTVTLNHENLPKISIPAHEFHRSVFNTHLKEVTSVDKLSNDRKWVGGYLKNNTFAQYAHINLRNAKDLVENFYKKALTHKNHK